MARDGLTEMLTKILGRIHNSRGREEFERVHREMRASTEVMMELLGKILAGTAARPSTRSEHRSPCMP